MHLLWAFILSATSPASAAEVVWATADTPSQRFSDDKIAGPTFTKGEQLELLVRDGDRARVRDGDKFGWVPAASITSTKPAEAASTSPDDLMQQLQVEEGAPPATPGK